MDLSKAFDSVCHNKLLIYLNKIGIKGKALLLFKSYLDCRHHRVKKDDILSESKAMTCGVPQGTVLSPLLYIIYVLELSNLKLDGSIYSYADDTALVVTGETWQSVAKIAENSLSKIIEWFSNNNLSLNYNKTVCITFSNSIKTSPNMTSIKAHDKKCTSTSQCSCISINKVDKTKYLGVTFDQHLRWNFHISELNMKLHKLYTFFNMSKHFLNIHWLKNTYYNLTQSLIEYGIVVWGNAAQTHINCLQIAQNTSLKIIYHKPRLYSSINLYSEAKILTVKQLYYKKTIYYMSKKNLIQPVVHTYNTRTEKLIYPKMNTTKYYNSYLITGLKLYEKIPISIKNYPNFDTFKLLIKKWLLTNEVNP